jgi:nucleoside-diphosphate-sugar epimerase
MRILVTGGAGFIGSHLVERLVEDGHDVLVLDNLATGKLDNLRGFLDVTSPLHFLQGDIRRYEVCHRAVQGREAVFHLAALGSVLRSIENPFPTNEVNVTGTLNLLEAARRNGVDRFIYSSSSSVYGQATTPEAVRKYESQAMHPLSPYGVSKLAAEHYCSIYWQMHGLAATSLRYFNVFGPRQNPNGPYAAVVPCFIRACLRGEPMVIHGDGKQSRDFTYVENVVEANILALERSPEGPYNIGCGLRTSVEALSWLVAEACGKSLEEAAVEHVKPRPGDVDASEAGITRAKLAMKYEPKVDVVEGLKRTVEWFRRGL